VNTFFLVMYGYINIKILSQPNGMCLSQWGSAIPLFDNVDVNSNFSSKNVDGLNRITSVMSFFLFVEIGFNAWRIILEIVNFLRKRNSSGVLLRVNQITEILKLPRLLNLFLLTAYAISFGGLTCFCEGRRYFYDYC